MMKTAHSRQGQNVARLVRACFNRPSRRCRLLQSDVRAVFVIVGQIITPKPPEMLLVQWDDVIEYFAARTSDPALGDSVLRLLSSLVDKSRFRSARGFEHCCEWVECHWLSGTRKHRYRICHPGRTGCTGRGREEEEPGGVVARSNRSSGVS